MDVGTTAPYRVSLEVTLEQPSRQPRPRKRQPARKFWLVLKSPPNVEWHVHSKQKDEYIKIVVSAAVNFRAWNIGFELTYWLRFCPSIWNDVFVRLYLTKSGNSHYVIMHYVIWANQWTELFVCCWQWAQATFDVMCLPAFGWTPFQAFC